MWFLIGSGLIGAGLFLSLRSLLPYLSAKRTGVIQSRGARKTRIERGTEPDRFKALAKQRLAGLWPGLACIAAGLGWLAYNFWALSIISQPA